MKRICLIGNDGSNGKYLLDEAAKIEESDPDAIVLMTHIFNCTNYKSEDGATAGYSYGFDLWHKTEEKERYKKATRNRIIDSQVVRVVNYGLHSEDDIDDVLFAMALGKDVVFKYPYQQSFEFPKIIKPKSSGVIFSGEGVNKILVYSSSYHNIPILVRDKEDAAEIYHIADSLELRIPPVIFLEEDGYKTWYMRNNCNNWEFKIKSSFPFRKAMRFKSDPKILIANIEKFEDFIDIYNLSLLKDAPRKFSPNHFEYYRIFQMSMSRKESD